MNNETVIIEGIEYLKVKEDWPYRCEQCAFVMREECPFECDLDDYVFIKKETE